MKKKIKSKAKGNNYELQIVRLMKSLGYESCSTSRLSSREQDNLGVDLCGTGCWNIQCKAWESAPSYHKVLASMPKKNGNYNLLFHKRNRSGSVVVMSQEDFVEILQMLIHNGVIKP